MTWKVPSFDWKPVDHPSERYCDIENIGRVSVKRTRPHAREFTCLINDNDYLCMHPTMDKAIVHMRKMVITIMGMDMRWTCHDCGHQGRGPSTKHECKGKPI
jgi:hypothetical protein